MKTPVKYGLFGLLGGVIGIFIMKVVGYQASSPEGIIIGCAIGGFIGGIIRDKKSKKS